MTDLLSLGEDAWDDSALIEAFEREVADYEAFHFGDKRPRKQKKKTSKKQVSKVTPASVPISTQQEEKTAELKSACALETTVESSRAHDVSVGSTTGGKSNKKPQDDVAQTSSQQANSYPSAPPPTNPQTLPDANQHIPGIQHYSQPHPQHIPGIPPCAQPHPQHIPGIPPYSQPHPQHIPGIPPYAQPHQQQIPGIPPYGQPHPHQPPPYPSHYQHPYASAPYSAYPPHPHMPAPYSTYPPAQYPAYPGSYPTYPPVDHQAFPHPPLPSFVGHDESLSKVLMAWYYSGYYTGLYESERTKSQSTACQQESPGAST
eukprot:856626_1